MPPDHEDHPEADQPLSMRWTAGRIASMVAVVLIVGFWAWIFAGGPRKANPDRMDDRAFVTTAEKHCVKLRADLAELPNAAFEKTAAARAAVLVDANVLVADMIDDLEAAAPTTGDDAQRVDGWLADWHTYLNARQDYARRLKTDPGARLLLDANPGGDPVDTGIEVFADVNDMPECATPGDVG